MYIEPTFRAFGFVPYVWNPRSLWASMYDTPGRKLLQEDSADEIGFAITDFVKKLEYLGRPAENGALRLNWCSRED
jgi:hypothetical protein